MIKNEKTSRTFYFSLLAAVLILINAILLGIVAKWFIGIMPTLPGSTGNDPVVLYSLSAMGSAFGAMVLLGALMMQRAAASTKVWGIVITVFSLPSVIMGGGFVVGFILGLIGGVSAVRQKSQDSATKPKKPLLATTDKTGKMRIEGVGPKIMAPMFLTFALTALLSYLYQPLFNYSLPTEWSLVLGVLFLGVGVPFWLLAAGMFLRSWSKERLETRGPFAVMLNPIYSSFIVFVIPGLSFGLNWWPLLLTSIVMYTAQQSFIKEEETALRTKFGTQYEEYRKKVLLKFL